MKKGTLFVVSGPSGCGKGTILAEVLKDPNLYYSVSGSSRPSLVSAAISLRSVALDSAMSK